MVTSLIQNRLIHCQLRRIWKCSLLCRKIGSSSGVLCLKVCYASRSNQTLAITVKKLLEILDKKLPKLDYFCSIRTSSLCFIGRLLMLNSPKNSIRKQSAPTSSTPSISHKIYGPTLTHKKSSKNLPINSAQKSSGPNPHYHNRYRWLGTS